MLSLFQWPLKSKSQRQMGKLTNHKTANGKTLTNKKTTAKHSEKHKQQQNTAKSEIRKWQITKQRQNTTNQNSFLIPRCLFRCIFPFVVAICTSGPQYCNHRHPLHSSTRRSALSLINRRLLRPRAFSQILLAHCNISVHN